MVEEVIHPVSGRPIRLGRTVARRTARSRGYAARLHSFLETLPEAPMFYDNTSGILDWGMMENDRIGDCTCACPGHMIQAWTAAAGKEITVPDKAIVQAYKDFCGYVEGDDSTDQGGDILTVLDGWRKHGIGGHKIAAHAEVNLTQMRVQQAMWIYSGMNVGISLPLTVQNQLQAGSKWDIEGDGQTGPSARGSWGGHCVPVIMYSPHLIWCVTWGFLQAMTWQFFEYYADEGHAIISPDCAKFPVRRELLDENLIAVGT